MTPPAKIVVTGALGHIGSRLIRDLPAFLRTTEIVMIDNLSTQRYASLFHLPACGRYRFIEGDILTAPLESIFSGASAVVHLAAITDAEESFHQRTRVNRVNLDGTERVAKACARTGTGLIFPSTTSVYGPHRRLVTERCPFSELNPQSPYAESKLNAEKCLDHLGQTSGLRFVTLRFGTIVGPSPGMRFHTAVNKFCWQAVTGTPLTVWRTALDQKRPYLDLGDAVSAVRYAIQHHLYSQQIYNVVTANLTVRNILRRIRRHIPGMEVQLVTARIMNQLSYSVSGRRLARLGVRPRGNLDQAIARTIRLIQEACHGAESVRR